MSNIALINGIYFIYLINYTCNQLVDNYSRYTAWLPDTNPQKRHDTKTTYQVEIRYANNTNETFSFHGPPGKFQIIRVNYYLFYLNIILN